MIYAIEKGVKVPTGRKYPDKRSKYPLRKMEIGDSFLIPHEQSAAAKVTIYSYARSSGIKVKVRTLENGFRVWRVA